ncbi:ADP-ribose pyrophosphatase, partial [Streptomyces sp. NPDC127044]
CLVVGVVAGGRAGARPGLDALRPAEAPWPARPFES